MFRGKVMINMAIHHHGTTGNPAKGASLASCSTVSTEASRAKQCRSSCMTSPPGWLVKFSLSGKILQNHQNPDFCGKRYATSRFSLEFLFCFAGRDLKYNDYGILYEHVYFPENVCFDREPTRNPDPLEVIVVGVRFIWPNSLGSQEGRLIAMLYRQQVECIWPSPKRWRFQAPNKANWIQLDLPVICSSQLHWACPQICDLWLLLITMICYKRVVGFPPLPQATCTRRVSNLAGLVQKGIATQVYDAFINTLAMVRYWRDQLVNYQPGKLHYIKRLRFTKRKQPKQCLPDMFHHLSSFSIISLLFSLRNAIMIYRMWLRFWGPGLVFPGFGTVLIDMIFPF